jgi:ribosome-binding factor A
MATTKQKKVERLVQKELGTIFQRKDPKSFRGRMITVTVVRISPDLQIVKAYLSIFPSKDKEEVLQLIRESTSEIRYELGNKIRNQVKKIPELKFFIDDSLDYIDNIDRLLNED